MAFDSESTYYRKAQEGKAFVVSEVYNVAAGSTANIHLSNPDSSGKQFWIMSATVSSDGPYIAYLHDSFDTEPSGGTTVEIENVLLDSNGSSSDDGVAEADENVSFDSSTSHAVGVGGGGAGGNAVGGLVSTRLSLCKNLVK